MTFVWLTPLIIFTVFLAVILFQESIFTRQQTSASMLNRKHVQPTDSTQGHSDRLQDETGNMDLRSQPDLSSISEKQLR